MKKEFDLKIDGGTLESIKIDSSNSLIVATYKRDVAEFKAGDIIVDDLGPAKTVTISIFKCINADNDRMFDIYASFDTWLNDIISIGGSGDEWGYIENQRLATDEEKQLLFDALKKEGFRWNADKLEIEKLDISEIVIDYESAIKYLGIKDTLLVFKSYDRVDKFNAQIKLQIIAEAWNKFDKFEADWENRDQSKYFPMFRVGGGKIEFARTSLSWGYLDFHTSNFSFKSEERARQFSEQFIDLFKVALGF